MKQSIRRLDQGDRQVGFRLVRTDHQQLSRSSLVGALDGGLSAPEDLDNVPLKELELSTRAYNALMRGGINSVGRLAWMSDDEIVRLRMVGELVATEIVTKLNHFLELQGIVRQPIDPLARLAPDLADVKIPLDALSLSARAGKAAAREGIATVGQLAGMTRKTLLSLPNIGEGTAQEMEMALRRYQRAQLPPDLTPKPRDNGSPAAPSTPPDQVLAPRLVGDFTPISGLGLSRRTNNALYRAGYNTIGKVAGVSPDQIRSIRNIGENSIAELKARLADWLIQQESSLNLPDTIQQAKPLTPLEVLADAPLDAIPLARLGLPANAFRDFDETRFRTLGDLLPGEPDSPIRHAVVREALQEYLNWLAVQTPETWHAEVNETGLNPIHRMALQDTTLEQVVRRWFQALDERQSQVIRLRFGLDSEPMSLKDIGARLGVTRERVRQIEKKALRRLQYWYTTKNNPPLFGFAALLHQQLNLHNGQLPLATFIAWLRTEPGVHIGNIQVGGLLELLCEVDSRFSFWRKHRLVTLGGVVHNEKPAVEDASTDTRPVSTHHRKTRVESQQGLVVRALESFGRPTHVSEVVRRAAELGSVARAPHTGRALSLLLQADDVAITLGDGVFSLITWEADRAREDKPVLPICPRPWVEVGVYHDQFLESIFVGRERLADEPAAAEFSPAPAMWRGLNELPQG